MLLGGLHLAFKQEHAPLVSPEEKRNPGAAQSSLDLFPIERLEICLSLEHADVINTERPRVAISQNLPLGLE